MKKIYGVLGAIILVGIIILSLLSRRFEQSYFDGALKKDRRLLERELGKESAQRVIAGVSRYLEDIAELWPHGQKGAMRLHRVFALHGVALYKALHDELGDDEGLLDKVEELFWDSAPKFYFKIFGYLLSKSRDPFGIFAWVAPIFTRYMYPRPPYEWEFVREKGMVGFDFKECPSYCSFFRDLGIPELTVALCNYDWHWMALFPPQIEMKRELCMGEGDDVCEFRWYRR